jgi:hypothetical protein
VNFSRNRNQLRAAALQINVRHVYPKQGSEHVALEEEMLTPSHSRLCAASALTIAVAALVPKLGFAHFRWGCEAAMAAWG